MGSKGPTMFNALVGPEGTTGTTGEKGRRRKGTMGKVQ